MTSPIAVLGITDFGNNWGERAWDRISGQRGTSFGKDIRFFISWETCVSGTHWKLKVVLLEREEARDQTFQRDSGRR